MIVWKHIRPKRLREAAFREALLEEMQRTGEDIKRDFQKTTATWDHEVEFEVLMSLRGGLRGALTKGGTFLSVLVVTDDRIYGYVNDGTEEHIIVPKDAKLLRFRPFYIPKTQPGLIRSISGGAFGNEVFSEGVVHPGTEARKFDKTLEKKWEKPFKRRMEKAMKRGAKRCGHGM